MATSQPTIDVRLRVNPRTCDLSRQTRFSLVVLLTLHSERSVTVAKAAEGLDIGLESLLQSGTIQCIDTVSSERIPIFDKSRDGDSESKEAKAKRPSLLFLVSTISEQQQGRLCDLYLSYETEGLRIRLRHKPPAAEQGVHNKLQPLGYALVEL